MKYSRIMGIDFGEVRLGIALSDLLGIIASPYQTYIRISPQKDLEYLSDLIKTKEVSAVVFGLPFQMDGSEGKTAAKVREFAKALSEKSKVEVIFEDERLSSVTAEEILLEANIKRNERKMLIDKIAAQVILEQYLEGRKNGK